MSDKSEYQLHSDFKFSNLAIYDDIFIYDLVVFSIIRNPCSKLYPGHEKLKEYLIQDRTKIKKFYPNSVNIIDSPRLPRLYNKFQMKSDEFPKATLLQALKETKKIKTNMKPFIAQYAQYNMPWLMQSISILFHNLTNQQTPPLLKMNSMFAVKCIVESCEYAVIALVQAYIFPIIRAGAFVDLNQPEDQRGADFFEVKDGDNEDDVTNYGYNYVLLCTQLVKVLAVIKPRNLFYDQQIQDLSDFEIANAELKKQLKGSSDQLKFFKQKPTDLNKLFKTKLSQFEQLRLPAYQKFILNIFKQQLSAQFVIKKDSLDIRRLIVQGDEFISQNILEYVGTVISQENPSCRVVCHALGFISDMVKSGNYGLAFFMHNNDCLKTMVKQVISVPNQSKDLNRGVNYLPRYKGTPDEHKKLYFEFLKHLDFWGQTFLATALKSPSPADQSSNLAKYLQILKKNQYEFPKNPLLDNQIRQTDMNLHRHRNKNKRLKEEVIDDVQPEQDNSTILLKSIKQLKSNLSIKKQGPQSNKKLAPPPQISPLKSERDRVKRIERAIELLTQNEKLLPDNMKTINTQLAELVKHIEENELQQNQVQELIDKQVEIQTKMEKINPVYEQYKTNKIDYKRFCQAIAPVSALSAQDLPSIKELEEPVSNIQQVDKDGSKNSISVQSKPTQNQKLLLASKASIPEKKQPASSKSSIPQKIQEQKSKPQVNSKKQLNSGSRASIPPKVEEKPSPQKSEREKINSKQNFDSKELAHSKVNFSESGLQQSKFTENVPQQPLKHQGNGVGADFEDDYNPVALMTKSRLAEQRQNDRYQTNQMVSPIRKIHYQVPEDNMYKSDDNDYKQERKKSRLNSEYSQEPQQQQYIENPSLVPLQNSFHDLEEIYQESRKSKSFKQAISNQKLFIKTNKKQNMFKMSQQCRSIVKPVMNFNKSSSSRVSSKINVPELLNQRSRKHEVQMKLLNQNKDKEIRQLMMKLKTVERQNSAINQVLRAKEVEIRSLKQNSQEDQAKSRAARSGADQFSLVDDQNFLLKKKFNAPNTAYNFKKTGENFKNQSRMLATGELIDSKPFQPYFCSINDEKAKKMFMKNKQLLFKSNQIEIGSIGQLKNGTYTVTIFVTPEQDIALTNVNLRYDDNIKIFHNLQSGTRIAAKRQLRELFEIKVNQYPYKIPSIELEFEYINEEGQGRIQFYLPCAFHKFFTIKNIGDEAQFHRQFEGNIIRGEEIPYSRKILKNIDLLQDFLPDLQKLSRGQPNQKGQVCYGGLACYNSYKFLVKISVKPNQFLYVQAQASEDSEIYQLICFYIATLNHFLTKNVDWN